MTQHAAPAHEHHPEPLINFRDSGVRGTLNPCSASKQTYLEWPTLHSILLRSDDFNTSRRAPLKMESAEKFTIQLRRGLMGTYGMNDFSRAARRSLYRTDQFCPRTIC